MVDCMIIVGVFPAAMSDWYLALSSAIEDGDEGRQ
jgi:hypothetical protein